MVFLWFSINNQAGSPGQLDQVQRSVKDRIASAVESLDGRRVAADRKKRGRFRLPGLVNIQQAIEHGHGNSGFPMIYPWKNGDVPQFFVCLPEGKGVADVRFRKTSGTLRWSHEQKWK